MNKLVTLFILGLTLYAGKLMAQKSVKSYIFQAEKTDEQNALTPVDINSRVHIRAARDFSKRFRNIEPIWHKTNDTTVARFNTDSVTTFVGYNKSGRWLYTVNCLTERQMPAKIRHEIKSQFYDFRIELVYRILYPESDEAVYLMYLADLNGINKIIRWSKEGVETVKKY